MSLPDLSADCSRCCGLCCIVYAFSRSPEFAVDKPAHTACGHLDDAFRCGIHDRRRDAGYSGCTTYECFGAGQFVTQTVFAGRGWKDLDDPTEMFDVFLVVRNLSEQLVLLESALAHPLPRDVRDRLHARVSVVQALTHMTARALRALDVDAERRDTSTMLRELRTYIQRPGANHPANAPRIVVVDVATPSRRD